MIPALSLLTATSLALYAPLTLATCGDNPLTVPHQLPSSNTYIINTYAYTLAGSVSSECNITFGHGHDVLQGALDDANEKHECSDLVPLSYNGNETFKPFNIEITHEQGQLTYGDLRNFVSALLVDLGPAETDRAEIIGCSGGSLYGTRNGPISDDANSKPLAGGWQLGESAPLYRLNETPTSSAKASPAASA